MKRFPPDQYTTFSEWTSFFKAAHDHETKWRLLHSHDTPDTMWALNKSPQLFQPTADGLKHESTHYGKLCIGRSSGYIPAPSPRYKLKRTFTLVPLV